MELLNHVPKIATFLYHPMIGHTVKLGQLFYRVKDIVHIDCDDVDYPILIVTFIDNQPLS